MFPVYLGQKGLFMTVAFNKILIPVDFSVNTETAINKALGFVGEERAIIYLLHVVRPGKSAKDKYRFREAEEKLERWKTTIQASNPSIGVMTHVLKGNSIQHMIIECAGMLKPDLIIIGKQRSRRRWSLMRSVQPDTIARKSNCPVLTAKPGSILSRTKIILIPIHHFFPERKLELAIVLAKKYRAQVHLLAVQKNGRTEREDLSPIFLRAYHQLREKLHHPIEYSSISRNNTVKATLAYAELIMADMILVNPDMESGVAGWTGFRHISDWLTRDSKIQVLDIQPYGG
jgi:nucleotide-binding universal stress UspA family protein